MTIDELLLNLAKYGGVVVSTAALTPLQISIAENENRLYVDSDGLGFVHMPNINEVNKRHVCFKVN